MRYRGNMRPAPLSLAIDPGTLALVLVAVAMVALIRRRTSHGQSVGRSALWFALAVVVLVVAYLSPLATLARYYLLTAHLAQITLVMAIAAPLLLLSLPSRTARGLPRAIQMLVSAVTNPVVALILVTVGFFAWHYAPAFNAALSSTPLYDLEQLTYLVTALIFWWPIVQPYSSRQKPTMSPMMRLGYILLATLPQTFGGLTVAMAHQVIYTGYGSGPVSVGWSALVDQQVAGACIALLNKSALFTAFMIVILRLLRGDDATWDDDGGLHRTPPQQPFPGSPPAPEWLADLERNRTVVEPSPAPRGIPVTPGAISLSVGEGPDPST